ncbi:hypothetical protein [Synechococcus sp. MIT S9504]|uniref:hypothetical protein n=2 Tax=Synechococcus sp. MIT S9504 TaxID=1801628 RepID=UPI000A7E05FC|nr:hypothetical protein [Synechococcus sp. MIT S9504]
MPNPIPVTTQWIAARHDRFSTVDAMSLSAAETARNRRDESSAQDSASAASQERVLCSHCGRTASNGISCIGMCVADSDY